MRIVVALGGNALLKCGEPMTYEAQRANLRIAAGALADLAKDHRIVVAHGNGPQVGLMALQAVAYAPDTPWPLDVLGAETEGMIGYLIEQELMNALPSGAECATLLTRVEVAPADPAFDQPTKPIGPVYGAEEGKLIGAEHLWSMVSEGGGGLHVRALGWQLGGDRRAARRPRGSRRVRRNHDQSEGRDPPRGGSPPAPRPAAPPRRSGPVGTGLIRSDPV